MKKTTHASASDLADVSAVDLAKADAKGTDKALREILEKIGV